MSQIAATPGAESSGIRPSEICENLDDCLAVRLLPTGAFKLITALDPERINSPRRAETLGQILSLELAVDDSQRRAILLSAVPAPKIGELEQPLRRVLLGFLDCDDCRPDGRCFRAIRNCDTHTTTYGVCSLSGTWEERGQRNNGRNGA